MITVTIKSEDFVQALGLCALEAEDLVLELPGYEPVDYSRDWEREDDEIWETCGLCEDSIELIERLAHKTCFELSQREWDAYGQMADAIEFTIRRQERRHHARLAA